MIRQVNKYTSCLSYQTCLDFYCSVSEACPHEAITSGCEISHSIFVNDSQRTLYPALVPNTRKMQIEVIKKHLEADLLVTNVHKNESSAT